MELPRIVRCARREPTDCTPVWFMRQAGRYMREYRDLRKQHSILELCLNAELAAQVTLMPVRKLPGLDAAILFSDILVLIRPMGIQVRYVQGDGPQILNPIRTEADIAAVKPFEVESLEAVYKAIQIVRRDLPASMALIGFAGAPFTLASYILEGGPSRHYLRTKTLMTTPAWRALMTKLAKAVALHLRTQIRAGCHMVQLFDSWAGVLSASDYREYVLPYTKAVFDEIGDSVPTIHFAADSAMLLEAMRDAGGSVISIDWRIPIDEAWKRVGDRGIQGNLDPAALLYPRAELLPRIDDIVQRARNRAGHLFNLGHGVLPETDIDTLVEVIERVHARTAR